MAAPLNQAPDFAKIFAVDLGSPLPSFAELKQSYVKNNIYDRKYDFSWNIGHKFDDVFAHRRHIAARKYCATAYQGY